MLPIMMGREMPSLKIALPLGGGHSSPHTWFLGPTRVYTPNSTSIGSAVFVGLTVVTIKHTQADTLYL